MIQDSCVCVDGQPFDVPCLLSKELAAPSASFKQLYVEIRAVHADFILATLGRWEKEAKGIVAVAGPKGSEPVSGALLTKTWDNQFLVSSLAGARRFAAFCDEAWLLIKSGG